MGKDIGKRTLRKASSFPRYVPSRCVPVSVLKKADETFRWVSNFSWPGQMKWMAYAGKVPLASNFATPVDGSDRFDWLGVWSIAQGLRALLEVRNLGEVAHGVKVLGQLYDATKYFRLLSLGRTDRWKASAMIGEKFVDETRMTMGHRASPQTAQRLSFVIPRYLMESFDKHHEVKCVATRAGEGPVKEIHTQKSLSY